MKAAHLVTKLLAALTVIFGLAAAATVIGAAPAGSPSITVYFAKDFTDSAYQRKAYDKVATGWRMPARQPAPGHKTVVVTTIARDGTVAASGVTMKSGEDAWDAAALDAVRRASPFAPFPPGYAGATTEVHFHFEWTSPPPKR
ncbi:MAG: TonB family protein [Acidobacteria bacterium]|nr:TonB family protein [Acidobacteriota bacterium]